MYQPGDRWMYNTGSDVLGVLLARVSRQSIETFLEERIFAPLGMKDTAFVVPETKRSRFMTQYLPAQGGALTAFDAPDGQWSRPPQFPSCAGGLVSTAEDCVAFGRMLLNAGEHRGRRILSAKSVKDMTTDQLTPAQKAIGGLSPEDFAHRGWGLGIGIITSRDPRIPLSPGSFGWEGGLGTSFYVDPSEGMVAVLLTQRAFGDPSGPKVLYDFWTAVYSGRR